MSLGGDPRLSARAPVRLGRAALLVALLTVLVPSMAYTGVVMTENAFYPVFLLSVLPDRPGGPRADARRTRRSRWSASGSSRSRGSRASRWSARTSAALVLYALTGRLSERRAYLRAFVPTARRDRVASLAPPSPRSRAGTARSAGSELARDVRRSSTRARSRSGSSSCRRTGALRRGRPGCRDGGHDRSRTFAAGARSRCGCSPPSRFRRSLAMLAQRLVRQRIARRRRDREPQRALRLLRRSRCPSSGFALDARAPAAAAAAWSPRPVLLLARPADRRLEYNAGFQSLALLPWVELSVSTGSRSSSSAASLALGAGVLTHAMSSPRTPRWIWLAVGRVADESSG